MEKTAIGTLVLFVVLSATFLFTNSDAWAWGSSSSYSSSYGSSGASTPTTSTSTPSTSSSSWGSSGTSSDGSKSWSSWSYSDYGSSVSEALCRKCHSDLKRFVSLKYENPDKHHLLINQKKPSNSIAPNKTSSVLYECFNCHSVENVNNSFVMMVTRDCLKCHPINTVTGPPYRSSNVHHLAQSSRQFSCNICHGVIGY
ncbi:MAG: hypothetical protein H7Y05_05675 [Steroidobacteraceae bacterium]|nr:hypothetical protein [Deltaproteobacteria bacterium]